MDRLEREAVESFRSVTSRGSEIGGLLIGSVAPGNPMIVSVAEYQVIDCEYSRGPLYRLSDADLLRFQRAIEQRLASGAGIAGFFRTHTRKGISLDPDDLAVLDSHFRDPHQIGLLVRPFATKASTGAIFIREGGKVNGDASYLEFPFRSPEGEAQAPAEAPEAKAAPVAPPAPQAPAAKPAARAQIVPIASRREISMPPGGAEEKVPEAPASPAASAVAAPPTPAAPVEDKARQQDKGKIENKPAAKVEPKIAPKVEPKVEAKPAPKVEAKQEAKPTPKVDPKFTTKVEARVEPKVEAKVEPKVEPKVELKVEAKPAARVVEKENEKPVKAAGTVATPSLDVPAKSNKGLKLVLAAAAATALFVLLFVYPGLLRQSGKSPNPAQSGDASALQLHVERANGELLLTWNRDSAAIRNATKAVLTINDGEQHENVEMDLAQLRNGSIVYSPQTADISFKMEVTGKDDSKTASESVRVLRTRPSPLQEQSGAQANGAAKPAATAPVTTPTSTPASATANTPPTSTPVAQTPDPNAQPETNPVVPTRSFNASTLSARLRPAQTNDLPDAPTVAGGAVPSAIPGVNLNAVTARPNAPVPPPAAPAAPTPTPQGNTSGAKSGGQIQSAVLIVKKDPEYPKLARQTGARGQVKLTATVGKDGHVKSVKVISGHPMLQAAAVEAVKQWIYKPTLLNGQAVETDTDIVLNFVGDR
ncbi:MAG TPA: TonB family protein [Candidatus Acidoferrum sp.]|nr:TonB family protein [Candidatus Acidoferrum sp.]